MRDLYESATTLPDSIERCINALEKAQNDTEKIAALFLIPKVIKDVECTAAARIRLMKAIGFTFLTRMLRSPASPDGCPPKMYQSVALTILSCFTVDEEIITDPSFLINVPQLLDIIGDVGTSDENEILMKDANDCMVAIMSTEAGREAVMKEQWIHKLCEISCSKMGENDDAMKLLENLLAIEGNKCWNYRTSSRDFNMLMMKLCQRFSNLKDDKKFEMCDTLRTVLRSFSPKDAIETPWMLLLQSELSDILLSKIGKSQRDPTIKLLAAVTEVSNFDWCQCDEERAVGSGHFLFVATNMVTIELMMQFEECTLDELMDGSDLFISCYFIIESATAYISSHSDLVIERKYAEKLKVAFKNGFGVILHLLRDVLKEPHHFQDVNKKNFIYATLKVVCAWLAEETMAMREDVIDLLPNICTLATESFSSQKARKLDMLAGTEQPSDFPDLLRFLLPGLCHLIVEGKPRKILLEMNIQETLYAYICYHWTIYNSYQTRSQNDAANEAFLNDVAKEGNAQVEMDNSKDAMTTICGIVMNLVVVEPNLVNQDPVFENFLEFVMKRFVSAKYTLMANFGVLGLLILEKLDKKTESTDGSVALFIEEVGRFLQEAHAYEGEAGQFEISAKYADHWEDIGDLWFLGMQSLSCVLGKNICYRGKIVESGWIQKIVLALGRISPSHIDTNSVSALESLLCQLLQDKTLLCQLLQDNRHAKKCIKDTEEILSVCQKHQMTKLITIVSSSLK